VSGSQEMFSILSYISDLINILLEEMIMKGLWGRGTWN